MSGHNICSELFQACVSGDNAVEDSGDSGIIDLNGKSFGICTLASDRTSVTLPASHPGVYLTVLCTGGTPTVLQVGAGSTVATMADNESVTLVCHNATEWAAGVANNKLTGAD